MDDQWAQSAEFTADAPPPPDAMPFVPKQVGRYRIKRLIASGGMGQVYLAVQDSPRRTVALKVMKPGVSSRSAQRRFEYEAQLLARLRHPGIAEVYDAGVFTVASPSGRLADDQTLPYFAMQYIAGARRITDYAAEHKLSLPQRIKLFIEVCRGVHHGHTKGIIHRDLKPDNILVDSTGQPKIIDFGVAKATDSDMAVTTLQTEVGQLVGTVQYMSPEQLDADPHDIDTRCDVYALGVILYELLTGRPPYDVAGRSVYDAARAVRETEPTRAGTVDRTLRGDLETIIHKALAKDRSQRYTSAENLADDLQRFLNHEPITARPPSLTYQLSTFVRRHRPLVAATGLVFAALLIGSVVSTVLYVQADKARDEAEAARGLADEQLKLAEERGEALKAQLTKTQEAEAEAAKQARIAKRVNEFTNNILYAANPDAGNRFVTIHELFISIADQLDGRFSDEPLVELNLRQRLGEGFNGVSDYARAEHQFRRALELAQEHLGPDAPSTLNNLSQLAYTIHRQSKYEDAAQIRRDLYERSVKARGEADTETARYGVEWGWSLFQLRRDAEAESLVRELIERLDMTGQGVTRAASTGRILLGNIQLRARRPAEAEPLFAQALEIETKLDPQPNRFTLNVQLSQALALQQLGRVDEAAALFEQMSRLGIELRGLEHVEYREVMRYYVKTLVETGRMEEVQRVVARYREELAAAGRLVEPAQPSSAPPPSRPQTPLEVAELLIWFYDLLIDDARRLHGATDDTTTDLISELGWTLRLWPAYRPEAIRRLREADDLVHERLGESGRISEQVRFYLGHVLYLNGQWDEAEPIYRDLVSRYTEAKGRDHDTTVNTLGQHVAVLMRAGRTAEAEPLLRELLVLAEARKQRYAEPYYEARGFLGALRMQQNQLAEAEALLLESYNHFTRSRRPGSSKTQHVIRDLVELYTKLNRPDEVERYKAMLIE